VAATTGRLAAVGSALDRVAWPVRSERLLLRPAAPADLDATWGFSRLEGINHWITSAPATREEYRQRFMDPERLAKTLVIELDGLVIGDLMLALEDGWAQAEVAAQAEGVQAELGWCIDPAYGGRGYATEAVAAIIDLCFGSLGLRRVVANCFAANEASWRLMDRLGMRRELHAVRESLHRSGEWMDGFGYALLADEWQANVANHPVGVLKPRPEPAEATTVVDNRRRQGTR
jgi:RimJ/RimL family protein N-acetyltransferase